MTRLRSALFLYLLVLLGSPHHAQGQSADPEAQERREQALTLLREGNEKLDHGFYLEALERFEHAQTLFPSPRLHFNIAQTLNELGRPLAALDHYERFLRNVKPEESPALRQRAQEQIFRLQGAIARVEVQCSVLDAQVTVDGKPAGLTPLEQPIRLTPGPHAVVVSKIGYEQQVIEIALGAGESVTKRIRLLTEDEGASTRRAVKRAEEERRAAEERLRQADEASRRRREHARWRLRTSGWIVASVGVASLLTAAVLGGLAVGEWATVSAAEPGTKWIDVRDNFDRAVSYGIECYATIAAGGALAVAGSVLIGLGYQRSGRDGRLALVPTLAAGRPGLLIVGRF